MDSTELGPLVYGALSWALIGPAIPTFKHPELETTFCNDYRSVFLGLDRVVINFCLCVFAPLRVGQIFRGEKRRREGLSGADHDAGLPYSDDAKEALAHMLPGLIAAGGFIGILFFAYSFIVTRTKSVSLRLKLRDLFGFIILGVAFPAVFYAVHRSIRVEVNVVQRSFTQALVMASFPTVWKNNRYKQFVYLSIMLLHGSSTLGLVRSLWAVVPSLIVVRLLQAYEASSRREYLQEFEKCGLWWKLELDGESKPSLLPALQPEQLWSWASALKNFSVFEPEVERGKDKGSKDQGSKHQAKEAAHCSMLTASNLSCLVEADGLPARQRRVVRWLRSLDLSRCSPALLAPAHDRPPPRLPPGPDIQTSGGSTARATCHTTGGTCMTSGGSSVSSRCPSPTASTAGPLLEAAHNSKHDRPSKAGTLQVQALAEQAPPAVQPGHRSERTRRRRPEQAPPLTEPETAPVASVTELGPPAAAPSWVLQHLCYSKRAPHAWPDARDSSASSGSSTCRNSSASSGGSSVAHASTRAQLPPAHSSRAWDSWDEGWVGGTSSSPALTPAPAESRASCLQVQARRPQSSCEPQPSVDCSAGSCCDHTGTLEEREVQAEGAGAGRAAAECSRAGRGRAGAVLRPPPIARLVASAGILEAHVLPHLNPTERALLGRACKALWRRLGGPARLFVPQLLRTLPLARWARAQGCPWDARTAFWAAHEGNLEVVKYVHASGCPWDETTCSLAAWAGHLHVLQWVRRHGCPWNASTCEMAAHAGHLEVLQWARSKECPWDERTCSLAAWQGHLHVLQWLHRNGCPWDAHTCCAASRRGHLVTLQWAFANGCPLNEFAFLYAAEGGHLPILQWAQAQGHAFDQWVCAVAAGAGQLALLQWLRAQHCPWDARTPARAAREGHLEVLQWVREQECPWNAMVCSGAARGGHLAVIQWARARGCPWSEDTCNMAALGGHLAVLQWARGEGCPWSEEACVAAARGGQLGVLQWLQENGCPWDERVHVEAQRSSNLEMLRWAQRNLPCGSMLAQSLSGAGRGPPSSPPGERGEAIGHAEGADALANA